MLRLSDLTQAPSLNPAGPSGQSCPIVPALLDGRAARWAALLSLVILALAVWRGWGLVVLGLALDFLLRALGRPGFSPVARAAGFLRRASGFSGQMVNAGPKQFAASLGALLSLAIGAALLAGWPAVGRGGALLLGLCAGLEAFFGFCVACQLHPWLARARGSHRGRAPVGHS
ncbi:MAG TPA: DUF4395 domain-containing protein [Geothrix sp.]|nr:DUF4395 domain-containing protein [Geothrix sp.]